MFWTKIYIIRFYYYINRYYYIRKGEFYEHLRSQSGSYVATLEYNGRKKQVDGFMEETTANRTIIKGMIEAVKLLKEPCKIHFYSVTQIGFRKIINKEGEYKNTSLKDNGTY